MIKFPPFNRRKSMKEEKITQMMPHYFPKKNLIFGATSSYYYVFSAKLNDMFFYKSKVNKESAKVPMTNDEIRHLLNVVMTEIDDSFKPMVRMIQFKFETEYSKRKPTQTVDTLKNNKVFTTSRNNEKEMQRKLRQREKELNKYTSIHPVILKDANENEIGICAKLNNEYYYISTEKGKEGFWKLSLTKSSPITIEETGCLLEYLSNAENTSKFAENMAPLYGAFLKKGKPNLSSWKNEVLFTKVRLELAKALQRFSSQQRLLCLKLNQNVRS